MVELLFHIISSFENDPPGQEIDGAYSLIIFRHNVYNLGRIDMSSDFALIASA